MKTPEEIVRQPAETQFAEELNALTANDSAPKPPGWKLSPRMVRTFILGSNGESFQHKFNAEKRSTPISQKFYGDDTLIDRAIVTLAGNRGLMLVGEPGTAKSMLSELLSAAISGVSTNTIQGTAGTTEDAIKYSWNFALLLAEGASKRALVPSPLYTGLSEGAIVRFEEITRCPPEIQDALVSVLSDKVLLVPELGQEEAVVFAKKGFNVIATANLRDRGVNEMSSALKRRFNFETVNPIANRELELKLVVEQTEKLLADAEAPVEMPIDTINLLVTIFQELRTGRTQEGATIERPSTVMSTAEAVAVSLSAALEAFHFGDGKLESEHLVKNLIGTVLKDNPDDAKRLKHYFDVIVKARANKSAAWQSFYKARKFLV